MNSIKLMIIPFMIGIYRHHTTVKAYFSKVYNLNNRNVNTWPRSGFGSGFGSEFGSGSAQIKQIADIKSDRIRIRR
jgi:hypothetical protein